MASEKRGPLIVTAAVIRRRGKVLIAQRRADSAAGALKWEFPGGKLEFGETPEKCLAREIYEELNLKIKVGKFIGMSSHVYDKKLHVVLLCYLCEHKSGELKLLEVNDAKWISPRDLSKFKFAAADIPLLPLVKSLFR